ncbi:MAG: hypothetical protein R2744_07020 [Bacteroidales bacterium]
MAHKDSEIPDLYSQLTIIFRSDYRIHFRFIMTVWHMPLKPLTRVM